MWVRSAISRPSSIITARRMSSSRRPISSPRAVRVRSMNTSDTELFLVDASRSARPPPRRARRPSRTSGSRRRRASGPSPPACSGSRSAKYSIGRDRQLLLPPRVRTRGRVTGTRRPPNVIDPCSCPCRLAARSGFYLPFGPTTSSTSASISSCTTRRPDTDAQTRAAPPAQHRRAHRAPPESPQAAATPTASDARGDLRSGYLLHGGPPVPDGLGLATTNAPNRSGRAGRTASNFYELPGNLRISSSQAFRGSFASRGVA